MKKLLLCVCLLVSLTATAYASDAVTYEEKTVGGVSMSVVVVDQTDPNIETKVVLDDNTIGATAPFATTVAEQDSVVSINGNFFNAYNAYKNPIGNLMSEGELLYSSAGMPNMGISEDGQLLFGLPGYFTYLTVEGTTQKFLAYDVNIKGQGAGLLRLYTSAFGSTVDITYPGTVYTFNSSNVLQSATDVATGSVVTIPTGGMVLYQYQGAESYAYPANVSGCIGKAVEVSYFLKNPDSDTLENFEDETLDSLLAGNVYLVKNGAVLCDVVYGSEGSSDTRWTSTAPRTAIGKLGDGRMLIVSTPSATLNGLASAMVTLGCEEAINLDGGASRALAVNGDVKVAPGRELTVTFHVYDTSDSAMPEQPAAPLHPFTDVVAGSYYENAVVWALENNVTTGMTATTFSPTSTCTRGQVVTFLWRAMGEPKASITENPFTDVSTSSPFYNAILWAVDQGITTGTGDGSTFSPSATCTTAQVLTFLHRANGAPAGGDSDWTALYPDSYFTQALAWADTNGLIAAVTDPLVPNAQSPRAHIVTYLYANAGNLA